MAYTVIPYFGIKQEWDAFCEDCAGAWFFHTTGWIEYTVSMPLVGASENLSFAVTDGGRLLALVPLLKEHQRDFAHLAYRGFNIPYPAFLNSMGAAERKAVEKFIFETIRTLSDVDYACFFLCGLSEEVLNGSIRVNPLSKHGFHDTTISTFVLNLQNEDEETMYRSFRKGSKSDIKTAQKRGFTAFVVDQENYEARHFDGYRSIHREAAGRQTRSDDSWERQRSWLQSGKSVLALLEKDGKYVSAAFVNTYKGRAYFQSAGTLPSFEGETGVGHLIQWEIIRYLKRKGFVWYEIGWNHYPNVSQEISDEKLLGISRFKGGFGADLYPLFRGEYFGSMDYMKRIYMERLAEYESLGEQSIQFATGAARTRPI